MIHFVHYEPQGQRQRFEPQERQSNLEQNQMYLHFSLDFRLNLDRRLRRARHTLHTPLARVTTIFAAFMGALVLALSPYWIQARSTFTLPAFVTLFNLSGYLIIAGALLGVGATLLGGVPLVVSAWRTNARSRLLFLVPILASLPTIACSLLSVFIMLLNNQPPSFFPLLPVLLFYGGTAVSVGAIIRAIRQASIADRWLRLANQLGWLVVGGIVLIFIGVVLWGVALVLVVPGWFAVLIPRLPLLCGMFLAVMVALWACFWRVLPRASQPRPHEVSSSENASSEELRGDRG